METRTTSRTYRIPVLFVCILLLSCFVYGQDATRNDKLKSHYTKHEYRVPMRDGVKLYTAVYVPEGAKQDSPFLIYRTPFGAVPYGEDHFPKRLGPSDDFDRAGYIFVVQDVRGRFQSEGDFVETRPAIANPKHGETDESTDMFDTVEWLLKTVPHNNGKVGIWGMSYPGFFVSASIVNSHPAIKAASPQAPVTNLFLGDDAYHGGAFMLSAMFEFYASFFKPRTDGPIFPPEWQPFDYGTDSAYEYFLKHGPDLKDIAASVKNPWLDTDIQHNTYDDYWQARDIAQNLNRVHCAVLNVAGWFDSEDLSGPLRTYHAIEDRNPGIFNVLVVGPWAHGGWIRSDGMSLGPLQFGSATSEFYQKNILFPFFEHYLKGTPDPHLPEAYVFETGSNTWRQYDVWPPKQMQRKTIYLHAKGKLSFEPPSAKEAAYDEYVSDPAHPVPYVERATTEIAEDYMYDDQQFASKRKDVLTYVSDPLTEDITIAGPISPRLQVSSSGTDSDFDLKLIDVYPGGSSSIPAGYEQLVRGEPKRARFRNSFSKPEAMRPNEITPINFDMPDVNHTFLRGHRVMVQIQSSWFPLTDLNPQKFVNTATAKRSDFVKATERVYHTPKAASGIVLNVLPKTAAR